MAKRWVGMALVAACFAVGCKKSSADGETGVDERDAAAAIAEQSGTAIPAEIAALAAGATSGQTRVSLRLSGGHLAEPLAFEGTVDVSPYFFSGSTSILGTGANIAADNGDAVLKQFVVSVETAESGFHEPVGGDVDIVFSFPEINKSYSLRARPDTGGMMIRRTGEEHVSFEMHFDASPTQISSRDLVYRLEGVIDARK